MIGMPRYASLVFYKLGSLQKEEEPSGAYKHLRLFMERGSSRAGVVKSTWPV